MSWKVSWAHSVGSCSPPYADFVLWAGLGWSCGPASQQPGAWRLHPPHATTCLGDIPSAQHRLPATFPSRRALSVQTNGPCHSATSFSLLVCYLSCPDNPVRLVLCLRMPRRSPGSDSPAFAPTKERHRQACFLTSVGCPFSSCNYQNLSSSIKRHFSHKGKCPLGLAPSWR